MSPRGNRKYGMRRGSLLDRYGKNSKRTYSHCPSADRRICLSAALSQRKSALIPKGCCFAGNCSVNLLREFLVPAERVGELDLPWRWICRGVRRDIGSSRSGDPQTGTRTAPIERFRLYRNSCHVALRLRRGGQVNKWRGAPGAWALTFIGTSIDQLQHQRLNSVRLLR
jgi:hypothetical protein